MNLQRICVCVWVSEYVCVCAKEREKVSSLKGQCDVIVIKCENHIKSQNAHNLCKLALASRAKAIK